MRKEELISSKRIVWIDLLRSIACFLVIVNHTNSRIFLSTVPSLTWFASLTYFFVSKIAVPLFVMISGYTLLQKEETYKQVLVRIGRMLFVLLVFSFFYYMNGVSAGRYETFNVISFVCAMLNEPITGSFWYIYMYLGLLVMLPFLRKLAKNMEQKDFGVFFAISFGIYGIYPMVEHLSEYLAYTRNFDVPIFGSYICMLFLGGYFARYGGEKSKRKLIICIVLFWLSCAFNVFATYLEYTCRSKESYLFFDNRTFFPIMLAAICVFYGVKCIKIGPRVSAVVKKVGECTFGIYLFSDFLIEKLEFIYLSFAQVMHPMFAMVIFEICVFACGFVVVFLLRKIPFVSKFI